MHAAMIGRPQRPTEAIIGAIISVCKLTLRESFRQCLIQRDTLVELNARVYNKTNRATLKSIIDLYSAL